MLVAMTYSVELFLCVVAGLAVGHSVLNMTTPVGESVDPCCVNQNEANPEGGCDDKCRPATYGAVGQPGHTTTNGYANGVVQPMSNGGVVNNSYM